MPSERLDFTQRSQPSNLPERMDEACSYEDFRACLVDLAQVNRVTLAHRPPLRWLDRLVATSQPRQPLRIVDVGCGGGDMLRSIAAWAKRRGIQVELIGVDLNPYAARAAREFSSENCAIEWITGDAFSYAPPEGIDVALSSLFTHHLEEAEIVRFLTWMETNARRGWFINDLYRGETSYRLFSALAKIARWHRFVQHDGPVSIRRGFREADWRRMCAEAGIDLDAVRIQARFPGRLCAERLK